jgi:hypothetical protein
MLARFSRREFFTERWDYQPGEQVFISMPTQGGKTRFMWDLMAATPHRRPPVGLVMKPRDPTPAQMTRAYGWKEIQAWPPPQRAFWQKEPPGYTLWPRHTLSLDPASLERTNDRIKAQFERCLMGSYKNGDQVVFVDEIYGLLGELGMEKTISALSNRGSGMGAALWYATQRPAGTVGAGLPGYLFDNPTHLFFGFTTVESSRKRISQIAGVDGRLVLSEVENLQIVPTPTPYGVKPISELLYCNKNGPGGGYMCIVGTQ